MPNFNDMLQIPLNSINLFTNAMGSDLSALKGTQFDNIFRSNLGLANAASSQIGTIKTAEDFLDMEEIARLKEEGGSKNLIKIAKMGQDAQKKADEANANMAKSGKMMAENIDIALATNSLMELQEMEKTESRFAKKREKGDLSQYTVPSSIGFFEKGGYSPLGHNYAVAADIPDMTDYIPVIDGIPVQTELGERILLPDGNIVKSNATKRHKKMEDDEVTDFLPEDSYVFSEHGFVITKEEADLLAVEMELNPYNPFEKQVPPTYKTLGNIFKRKKKMSPSEIAGKIEKKFSISKEDDIFAEATNQENLLGRKPWLEAVISLSELKKDELEPVGGDTQEEAIEELVPQFGVGGQVVRQKGIQKAPLGAIISGIGLLSNLIGNRNQSKKADRLLQENLSTIEETTNSQKNLTGLGAAASAASILGQDFSVDAPELSTSRLEAIPTRTPRAFSEFQMNRLLGSIPTRQAFSNAPNYASAMNSLAPMYAQAAEAASQTALNAELDRMNRETAKLQGIQAIENQQEILETNADNQETSNRNRALTGLGGVFGGMTTTLANIEANKAANELAARGANFAATSQLQNQFSQSLMNAGALFQQIDPQISGGGNNTQAPRDGTSVIPTSTPIGCPPGMEPDGLGGCRTKGSQFF